MYESVSAEYKTVFRNPTSQKIRYPFLGPYGITLYGQTDKDDTMGLSDTYTILGTLFEQPWTARYDNYRLKEAIVAALASGKLEIVESNDSSITSSSSSGSSSSSSSITSSSSSGSSSSSSSSASGSSSASE